MVNARCSAFVKILVLALIIYMPILASGRHFVLVLEDEEVKEVSHAGATGEDGSALDSSDVTEESAEWEEFGDSEDRPEDELDPGSWRRILEETPSGENISSTEEGLYVSGVNKMMFSVSEGEPELMKEAISDLNLAADGGYAHAQSTLGFLYASGCGVEQSDSKAFLYHHFAAEGGNVQSKMALAYTYYRHQAREYFKKAADNDDANGHYNLGVLYLKGMGVKKDVKVACRHFITAANAGQPKAFYQLAKMFQKGVGLKKDLAMAATLYKIVAERGPWGSLLRWALECYLKGQTGKALLLYSRVAELGYEIAQSNAAWILDKYGQYDICIGKSGFCTDNERHQLAHTLWWHASEQGNEHAALLIGDAYYYGRGTERDFDRAAEAYMHAHSQSNAQAMFNLGYMHEHGQGLPFDLHLAKRYYDQALEFDPAAKLPVTLALFSVWIRKNYADSCLVTILDSLPEALPRLKEWLKKSFLDDGNVTLITLFVCLLTVLYLRERQRRMAANAVPPAQVVNN